MSAADQTVELTAEPRRSTRTPKPKVYDSEDSSPPRAKRRTNGISVPTKKQLEAEERRKRAEDKRKLAEEKRARAQEQKLERQRKREREAFEKQQKKLEKQQRKLQRDQEKQEAAAKRAREKEAKRIEREKLKEQKLEAKRLKNKPKEIVNSVSFQKFLSDRGVTTSGTPDDLTTLLDLARKYHAQRNGNAVLSKSKPQKLTANQLAALKDKYTKQSKDEEDVMDVSLLPSQDQGLDSGSINPLSTEEAVERVNDFLEVMPVLLDSDSDSLSIFSDQDSDLVLIEAGAEATDSGLDEDLCSDTSSVVELLIIEEDQEIKQLQQEQKQLEKQVLLTQRRKELRERNQELRNQLDQIQ